MQRILIIEDDAAIAHLMESTLRREQYNTIWAADGVQGADLFETGHFDLILLDLMLPGISGFELLEYFVPSKVPVIIISAMGQVENRIKGLKMGAIPAFPEGSEQLVRASRAAVSSRKVLRSMPWTFSSMGWS